MWQQTQAKRTEVTERSDPFNPLELRGWAPHKNGATGAPILIRWIGGSATVRTVDHPSPSWILASLVQRASGRRSRQRRSREAPLFLSSCPTGTVSALFLLGWKPFLWSKQSKSKWGFFVPVLCPNSKGGPSLFPVLVHVWFRDEGVLHLPMGLFLVTVRLPSVHHDIFGSQPAQPQGSCVIPSYLFTTWRSSQFMYLQN